MDRALSGATILGQSGPGSNGNEGVLRIPQSPSITGTSPSDCLVSYPGHSLGGSYPFAEVQSAYSTGPVDWAITYKNKEICPFKDLSINKGHKVKICKRVSVFMAYQPLCIVIY